MIMDEIAFRAKKWTEWCRSLEWGANVVRFNTLGDLNTACSIALNQNTNTELPYRFSIHAHREQLVANFVKLPRDGKRRKMTQDDAVLLEKVRYLPPESVTEAVLGMFETETGRNKARTITALNKGEKLIREILK